MLDFMQKYVGVKKLHPDAITPTYATEGDAGADLYACIPRIVTIEPQSVQMIKTGLAIAIPYSCVGLVHPRSGLAAKKNLTVANAPGTIDSGYRGELCVLLTNLGRVAQTVEPGDRIAQLVIQKVENALFVEVDELDVTSRGTGGFGSTGK